MPQAISYKHIVFLEENVMWGLERKCKRLGDDEYFLSFDQTIIKREESNQNLTKLNHKWNRIEF